MQIPSLLKVSSSEVFIEILKVKKEFPKEAPGVFVKILKEAKSDGVNLKGVALEALVEMAKVGL